MDFLSTFGIVNGLNILGTAASATRTGAIQDMAGLEGIVAILKQGVMNSSAASTFKMQQDSAAAMGSAADLLGTGIAIADDDDNQIFAIELVNPEERYVRCAVAKNGAQTSDECVIYIVYGSRVTPEDNNVTDLITSERHIRPAEGTA